MNLELLDPWEQEYPQVIGETLEDGDILNCKFNRRGTLLAAGCQDGRFIIWDMDTKGIARDVEAHSKSVTNVSWSRNGRYLLTVSKDWTCVLWDLLTADVYRRARFDAPPLMAHMHPKKNFIFVAALMQSAPYVVDLSSERARMTRLSLDSLEGEENSSRPFSVSAVAWNKTGKRIYAGTTKGYLYIFDSSTFKAVYSTRVTTTTIKEIQWGRNGKDILFNSNDRVIRLYQVDDYDGIPVLKNKFQDLVNRIQWNTTCISADGEFVVGGSGHKAEHNIYIWDKEKSNLVKILEGPKDSLDDLAWHPVRPIIASVSSYGNIYMWTIKNEANWSAFAPDFTELEENLEYEEKEDEFDVVPEEEVSKRKQDDEDIEVDVTTCEDVQAFVDSDDDEDTPEEERKEIFYLPPLPFGDGVTKAPTKRRRSLDMVVNSIKKRAPRA